ncbi:class I SAM-dependent methyltransferase [Sporolactobacillus pectinivorans]|uniref:class I SAM-dependent methyltransferase n=1 Tax=Sporolactobacillus pectinivorans TaxID=1591408 RepID=UPI000C269F22|nr:class I SAM-dependent methyltransferase [Sporolactobacillus pectinivorans]
MSEHYYSEHPHAASHRQITTAELRGNALSFVTDSGVFSKKGIDFGSRLLIESFREPEIPGKILDMGCGYGPIGISLGRSFPTRQVMMVDINERAVALAKENAKTNGVDVLVSQSDLYETIEETYAAIVTNPPIRAGKKIVRQILTESYQHLEPGGELWAVIQKKQGGPSALTLLQDVFGRVDVAARKKGYHVFCARKG